MYEIWEVRLKKFGVFCLLVFVCFYGFQDISIGTRPPRTRHVGVVMKRQRIRQKITCGYRIVESKFTKGSVLTRLSYQEFQCFLLLSFHWFLDFFSIPSKFFSILREMVVSKYIITYTFSFSLSGYHRCIITDYIGAPLFASTVSY